jgi:DNA invertase Pin-like site-specific DNA recombinase
VRLSRPPGPLAAAASASALVDGPSPPAEPVVAVSYAAKSSPDPSDSVGAQQAAIRQRAQHLGRSLVGEYAEANRSGWRGNRGPELEAAISRAVELASEHPVVELWVWHSSRLGRGSGLKGEARSVLEIFAFLRRRGVTLRSVDDDQFLSSSMLVGFAAELAERYSADLSGWTRAGKDRQWERGDWIGGPVPDGYRTDGTPKQRGQATDLLLDPERAAIIRRIFERALDGGAPARIARELNADGLRTKASGAWTRRRIQDTLTNAHYAGLMVRWRGTEREQRRPGRHTAIVTEEEFAAVAQATARRDAAVVGRARADRPSSRFLLATLARCGTCGATMYSRTSSYRRKDGVRARSYLCAHVVDGTGLCNAPPQDAERIDEQVLARLPRFIEAADRWLREMGSDRQQAEARADRELVVAEQRVRELEARVAGLSDRYALEAETDVWHARAEAVLDALVTARQDLKRGHARVRRAAADLAAVQRAIEGDPLAIAHQELRDALRGGEAQAVREFNRRLREHFDAFVIDSDGTAIPIWKVEMPAPLARHLNEKLNSDAVAGYVSRRLDELGLTLSTIDENRQGSQASRRSRAQLRRATPRRPGSRRPRPRRSCGRSALPSGT